MYKRLSFDVIQEQKRSHKLTLSRLSKVAVILLNSFVNNYKNVIMTATLERREGVS
jgi:hypothetical protein